VRPAQSDIGPPPPRKAHHRHAHLVKHRRRLPSALEGSGRDRAAFHNRRLGCSWDGRGGDDSLQQFAPAALAVRPADGVPARMRFIAKITTISQGVCSGDVCALCFPADVPRAVWMDFDTTHLAATVPKTTSDSMKKRIVNAILLESGPGWLWCVGRAG